MRPNAEAGIPMLATRPEDIARTTPPRPIVPTCSVTALDNDERGVFDRTGARWRAGTRVVTVNLSDACEVSCRVRVGETPGRWTAQLSNDRLGFTPRSVSRRPECGSPASAMRCGTTPWAVAELGVHPGGFSEGEKRSRSYRNPSPDVTSGSQRRPKSLQKVTDLIRTGDVGHFEMPSSSYRFRRPGRRRAGPRRPAGRCHRARWSPGAAGSAAD